MPQERPNGVLGKWSNSPFEELSWRITKYASIVSHFLDANLLPQPSFEADGPSTVLPNDAPQGIHEARQNLISAALEILQLAIGPSDFLPHLGANFQYISCLDWLCRFRIFQLIPVNGDPISYEDLAAAAGVPMQRLKSIIRMAMTNALFRERNGGTHVAHSAASALLGRSPDAHAYASYASGRSAPMALGMATAHERWGADTMQLYETAYNVAFATDLTFWDHLSRDEARTLEFAAYLKGVRNSDAMHIRHLVAGFRWQDIPDGGLVVDVGGSTGASAIALAEAFPQLRLLVQDLPANVESGQRETAKTLPESIARRLSFQSHDFTQPQPVRGADVYLMRMILHDWPDGPAADVLKHLLDAMDPQRSRLLIMETVLPEPGTVPVSVERLSRALDLTMMQAFNSRERTLADFEHLLKLADPRAKVRGVVHPLGSVLSVIEVALDP